MLIIGILFILLGTFTMLNEKYEIKVIDDNKEIVTKETVENNVFHRYKMVVGIFAVILGVFSILNYIIY